MLHVLWLNKPFSVRNPSGTLVRTHAVLPEVSRGGIEAREGTHVLLLLLMFLCVNHVRSPSWTAVYDRLIDFFFSRVVVNARQQAVFRDD